MSEVCGKRKKRKKREKRKKPKMGNQLNNETTTTHLSTRNGRERERERMVRVVSMWLFALCNEWNGNGKRKWKRRTGKGRRWCKEQRGTCGVVIGRRGLCGTHRSGWCSIVVWLVHGLVEWVPPCVCLCVCVCVLCKNVDWLAFAILHIYWFGWCFYFIFSLSLS